MPMPTESLEPRTLGGPGMNIDSVDEDGERIADEYGRGYLVAHDNNPEMIRILWSRDEHYLDEY